MSNIFACPESKFINYLRTKKYLHGMEPGISLSIESSLNKYFSKESIIDQKCAKCNKPKLKTCDLMVPNQPQYLTISIDSNEFPRSSNLFKINDYLKFNDLKYRLKSCVEKKLTKQNNYQYIAHTKA